MKKKCPQLSSSEIYSKPNPNYFQLLCTEFLRDYSWQFSRLLRLSHIYTSGDWPEPLKSQSEPELTFLKIEMLISQLNSNWIMYLIKCWIDLSQNWDAFVAVEFKLNYAFYQMLPPHSFMSFVFRFLKHYHSGWWTMWFQLGQWLRESTKKR